MVVKDLPRRTSPLTTIPARRGFWLGFASRRPSARPFTTIPARRGFWLGFASRRPSVRPFTAIPARRGFWLLLAAGFVVILLLLYRADIVAYQATMLIWSSTRHASAGRVALSAMLAMGLLRWIPWRWQRWSVATGLAVLFLINIYILLRVQYPFQHCPLPDATSCLSTIR